MSIIRHENEIKQLQDAVRELKAEVAKLRQEVEGKRKPGRPRKEAA